jgi:hypothetical protein
MSSARSRDAAKAPGKTSPSAADDQNAGVALMSTGLPRASQEVLQPQDLVFTPLMLPLESP